MAEIPTVYSAKHRSVDIASVMLLTLMMKTTGSATTASTKRNKRPSRRAKKLLPGKPTGKRVEPWSAELLQARCDTDVTFAYKQKFEAFWMFVHRRLVAHWIA